MNSARFRKLCIPGFLIFICAFSACTKIVTTNLGSGLASGPDGVNTKDTILDVISKNGGDSVISVSIAIDHVMGYMNDPIFGKTTANINAQFKPTIYPVLFERPKDQLVYDSMVLVLGYQSYTGDSTQNLAFRVYEIKNDFDFKDSAYNNEFVVPREQEVTENNMAKTVDIRHLRDSVYPFNEAATSQIRIKLSASFGQKFLNTYDTTSAYKNDSLFTAAFKGLQIAAEQTGNALIRVNLLDTNSKLALYYHYTDTSGKVDTSVKYFRPGTFTAASSNYIARDRSLPAEIGHFFPPNMSVDQDSLIYIQSGPGTYATIKIPGLSGLPNMIIHRAELIMEQVTDNVFNSDTLYNTPNLFLLAKSDSAFWFNIPGFENPVNIYSPTSDAVFSSTSGILLNYPDFGGIPANSIDPLTGKTKSTYNFSLTRYVQGIVTNHNPTYTLILYSPYNEAIRLSEQQAVYRSIASSPLNYPGIGRVRLGGGNNSQYKMRFHIVYSTL
ncbi:MAG: DUF4270 family protein [Bacteroidetes bacterium]|nr:DUF4270 family protein [Bacteroidota bacterium]